MDGRTAWGTHDRRRSALAAEREGLYRRDTEHANCGVAFVARRDGSRTPEVVASALDALARLAHRGAAGSDPETGDGAGILLQVPHRLLADALAEQGRPLPAAGEYALGMLFLPRDAALRAQVEREVAGAFDAEGLPVLAWRSVPIDPGATGPLGRSTLPTPTQVVVGRGAHADDQAFDLALYLARKRLRREVSPRVAEGAPEDTFYVCSLSRTTVVYKGLLLPSRLGQFYPDLTDPKTCSALAIVHQRFSTNTFPSWERAHPYRLLAHNGEINTLRGNVNWMRAREILLAASGDETLARMRPVLDPSGSDSSMLDDALELLLRTGRSIPHALAMLVPPAWQSRQDIDPALRAFYEVQASLMEPWDGPACVVFSDGRSVGAALDRNGLRPARWVETRDGHVVLSSEAGVFSVEPDQVLRRGRLGPGGRLLVDTETNAVLDEADLEAGLAGEQDWTAWADRTLLRSRDLPVPRLDELPEQPDRPALRRAQRAFGYSREDLRTVLAPMAKTGKEPIGAMGNDTPLAVLSEHPRSLFDHFKQLFAQVTNPPIDPLREDLVMSLRTTLGREHDLFAPGPAEARQLELDGPILTPERMHQLRRLDEDGLRPVTLDACFEPAGGGPGLEAAIDALEDRAVEEARAGTSLLILSDRSLGPDRAAIPAVLATAAVNHRLVEAGLRHRVGLVVESGEPREVMHFALLSGYGAGAVHPYLLFETVADLVRGGELVDTDLQTAVEQTIAAIHGGLRKVLSKMGISTLQSYRGAQIFEAIGLSKALVERYFPGTPSRLDGVGLAELADDVARRHRGAFPHGAAPMRTSGAGRTDDPGMPLDTGGRYQWRRDGERHALGPETIGLLQHAVRGANRKAFRTFAQRVDESGAKAPALRHLLRFRSDAARPPVPLDDVEPVAELVRRFRTGAMSFGSLSAEAHENLALAMNQLGGRSNSGEGGEDPRRYRREPDGGSRRSAIKQVASGRFGVTAQYLVEADELQIKMAQGAKPGEGGHLPGHKVDGQIAQTRCATPGVGLISPPPHHDIYSIEDLAQLIHDLRCANDQADVSVKLVSEVGVGTVAAGVAKAGADTILISGQSGGTGASPLSSLQHAGVPWELGLAEAQQVLVANDLRGRVRLEVDGQLKTARDVVVAGLLGAEGFGFGTAALIASGCILMRVCHLNTCPVGVATQDPELRKRFKGQPEHVITFFVFLAEEVRRLMAELGFRRFDELVGRADALEPVPAEERPGKGAHLDLSALLHKPEVPDEVPRRFDGHPRRTPPSPLERHLLEAAAPALRGEGPVEIEAPVTNLDRTVGTRLSSALVRRHGPEGLADDTVRVRLLGTAGQSFGAFVGRGITLELEGEANDAVGKGLSGGRLIVRPPRNASFDPKTQVILGNVALYGATQGALFARGRAGERFAVRNSGALAVVEGVGDHGCEYMTGGTVVVLGPTGRNFAAGMSGGVALVHDPEATFERRVNRALVDLEPLDGADPRYVATLRRLLEDHLTATRSDVAWRLLQDFDGAVSDFVLVMPREYRRVLEAQGDLSSGDAARKPRLMVV